MHYFFKSKNQWFIDCEWLNTLDFTVNAELDICKLTLNNVSDYWSGTITRNDLDNFVRENTSLDQLSKVVSAGLQGETEYDDQPLSWKIAKQSKACKMVLVSYMGRKIPYELGSIQVPIVPSSGKAQVMQEWMENTVTQCLQYKEAKQALLQRNQDLVANKEKLDRQLDELKREKVESDMNSIQKMKELLNNKKKRIRRLIMQRDQLMKPDQEDRKSDTEPATVPKKRSAQSKANGRSNKRARTPNGESSSDQKAGDKDQVTPKPTPTINISDSETDDENDFGTVARRPKRIIMRKKGKQRAKNNEDSDNSDASP